jgi:hypothetical protein
MNTSDDHIKVTWYDKNRNVKLSDQSTPELDESFAPNVVKDVWMEVHELQIFRFQRGTKMKEDSYAKCFPTSKYDY